MTCLLSTSLLYQTQYKDNVTDLQNNAFKYLDLNWIVNGCQHSGILGNQTQCSKCHIDADKVSLKMCQLEISDEILEHIKYVQHSVPSQKMYGSHFNTNITNENDLTRTSDMCVRSDNELGKFEFTKVGVKRKADTEYCVEVYIPQKRVSPFLNTPKEKKDERKNVLNISMKKIKELDDPEIFLRRSVLINNLTKRLQTELQHEKQSSRKFSSYRRKCFSDYKVLNNSCLSDIYLDDDPFLSDTHEAITDDMTDTLINNVLNDSETNKTKGECDS